MTTQTDAALDHSQIETTADRIVTTYRQLVTDPANHAEVADCVPLRLIRQAMATEPREYVDAALLWLDTQPAGMPFAEISCMDEPTQADEAAAVSVEIDGETFQSNLVWLDTKLN